MDLAIETSGLTKKYGSLTAVNKLDLKVKRNTIHGFLGPNGAGKTTTIKILVGLLRPNEGTVKVLGQELHGVKSAGFLQSFYEQADSRLSIGYMPELPIPETLERLRTAGYLRANVRHDPAAEECNSV
jgi:ABC-type multidrug transport system ATPase subunit